MASDVENSIQSISELANSAGNYFMGNVKANNYTTSACGKATLQPSVKIISGSAIVDVAKNPRSNQCQLILGEVTKSDTVDKTKNLKKN
jgi:hypothetical protein